jgi:plastocyanin
MIRLAAFGATALLAFASVACSSSSAEQPTPFGSPATTVTIVAHGEAFDQTQLTVPANQTFAVAFDNEDSQPHNVAIRGNGATRAGEIFSGPGERTYVFAGLPAGTYAFLCDVHPNMAGTIVVGGNG